MDPDFWHHRWERNQIGFHQDQINRYLVRFWNRVCPSPDLPDSTGPSATALVPLCGKSLDMIWLADQGQSVLGVELSPRAVRDFFDENRLEAEVTHQGKFERWESDRITILCGDFFDLTERDVVGTTCIFDRAALIAFPAPLRERYAGHLLRISPPNVPILLITLEYDQAEMAGPPFAVQPDEVQDLFDRTAHIETLDRLDVLDAHPRFAAKGLTRLRETAYLLTR